MSVGWCQPNRQQAREFQEPGAKYRPAMLKPEVVEIWIVTMSGDPTALARVKLRSACSSELRL
jgi:hypothetical protein